MSNRAWVTLATNDSYGLGALVLAHSLRRAGSLYPAVVLVTPSVTYAMRDRLSAVFAEAITVNVLDSGDAAHLGLLQRPELGITITKIHCWNLTNYEKCVFLDADALVVQNCDELFDREELSAAPDVGWPDCFNSGVFVFRPSKDTFEKLIKFAQERGSFDGGDQGLLNLFFSDWPHGDINKHLPFLYNVTSAAFYSYQPALKQYGQDLKIMHFIGTTKPWLQQFNWDTQTVEAPDHIREFLQLWWNIFVQDIHSKLDESMWWWKMPYKRCHYQMFPTTMHRSSTLILENQSQHHLLQDVCSLHLDHIGDKSNAKSESDVSLKGDLSENEFAVYKEINPSHPYDNSYLRHRMTIDSRGRKICSHELPPTPSISPPPVSPLLLEDIYETASECEDQSGVAGDLSRLVLTSSGYSRDSVDELARRQAWEAGNIDYMGADSFANIWAKISETLNQPRTSPPKQSPQREVPVQKQLSPHKERSNVKPDECESETLSLAVIDHQSIVQLDNSVRNVPEEVTTPHKVSEGEPHKPIRADVEIHSMVVKTQRLQAKEEALLVAKTDTNLELKQIPICRQSEISTPVTETTPICASSELQPDTLVEAAKDSTAQAVEVDGTVKNESETLEKSEVVSELSRANSLILAVCPAKQCSTPEATDSSSVATDSPPLLNTPSTEVPQSESSPVKFPNPSCSPM